MKVFDKASWQIDNGLPKEIVINHFTLLFEWLNKKGYLTNAGKEILKIGIDDGVSLNDRLVTKEGKRFLEMFYDKIIEESGYDLAVEKSLLEKYDRQLLTKREYVKHLRLKKIDAKKVKKVQGVYKAELPDVVKKIISNNDESIFFDDGCRILSYQEVIDAEKDLQVDFIDKGIIPLADCGENDFIVYHFNSGSWSIFNIVDETEFKKKSTIEELLN